MTRAISVVAVIVCLTGYNTVLDKREQAEEQIRKQQAELEQEQSVDAAKEGTTTDGAYKDGTYTGEAQGFGGPIDVAVIIENGKISEINITSAEKEDGAYLSMAEDIIPSILEAQSADVDTISGATFSSTGIKEAVALSLKEAVTERD
mgnify:CR=1 FL=1